MVYAMHPFAAPLIVALALLAPAPDEQFTELFQLANGGQILGRLLNRNEVPRTHYDIETADGARITLARDQVAKVVRQSPIRLEYDRVKPTYPDTVDGQLALAAWCQEHGLASLRKTHLERVLELEPNHELARRSLGYRFVDGQWKTRDQVMQERGHVRYKNSWKLPQEVEVLERERKNTLAESEWIKRLRRFRDELASTGGAAAAATIRQINDPYALRALSDALGEEADREVRLLYVEAVGNIADPGASVILAKCALYDSVEDVRHAALDRLKRHKPAEAIKVFLEGLRDKDNQIVNRAATGLAQLEAREATGALIGALVTTHKFKVNLAPPGEYNATFARPDSNGIMQPAPSGAGGLTMGNSVRVYTQKIRNVDVLDALIALTGVNYDYDTRAWKSWQAAQKRPTTLDARRDES